MLAVCLKLGLHHMRFPVKPWYLGVASREGCWSQLLVRSHQIRACRAHAYKHDEQQAGIEGMLHKLRHVGWQCVLLEMLSRCSKQRGTASHMRRSQ
jgi:hypothetical protein